ncbi:MAG: pyruvate ferredoxin oxidoreductase [Nanoarchaeota archaeon]|nr:pyruvate ferredoxin oxidoreductase [Nanoarchaeota archaeon]
MNLKELSKQEERLESGHRLCPGCALPMIARQLLHSLHGEPVVVGCATGCLEVSTTIYPYTAWKTPWIHNAFENVAATMSGAETAYRVLQKRGKIPKDKKIKFLAIGGDGGTYDIGLQSLSGTLERGHNLVYVCMDNEAYQNTGIQRSSSTPFAAATNTSPVGKIKKGKEQFKKDLTAVIAGHHIPYVAQASPHNWVDLMKKAEKAFAVEGPAFINTISPCVPGWGYKSDQTQEMARLAVDTCFWPLFEIENDVWKLNYNPGDKKEPIINWCKHQARFRHLLKPENKELLDKFQAHVDERWEWVKKQCGK